MAPRTHESRADRAPFCVGGEEIRPGRKGRVDIPVGRLPTGAWLTLPVAVVHGRCEGPTIWLSGTIHGDELNGIPIINELVRETNPGELAGTILAVPIVNVFGLIIESRYLPDRRDLNRSFPGSARGSLASRLARLFVDEIVSHCDYGIDFHTGSNGRANLPQIRCSLDDERSRRLAEVFSPPLILDSKRRPGSLRDTALDLGITALVYEAGAAHHFDRDAIRIGTNGTRRVLNHLGMLDREAEPSSERPWVSRSSTWARSRRGGLCQMSVELGEFVQKGQELAVVFESLGSKDATIRAPHDGVVIGQLDHAMVTLGEAIAHVAAVENPIA